MRTHLSDSSGQQVILYSFNEIEVKVNQRKYNLFPLLHNCCTFAHRIHEMKTCFVSLNLYLYFFSLTPLTLSSKMWITSFFTLFSVVGRFCLFISSWQQHATKITTQMVSARMSVDTFATFQAIFLIKCKLFVNFFPSLPLLSHIWTHKTSTAWEDPKRSLIKYLILVCC